MQLPASPLRPLLTKMLRQALASVHAGDALRRTLHKEGDELTIGLQRYNLRDYERIVVVGAGKATAAMARAIEPILGRHLDGGVVIVKYGHGLATKRIAVTEAGHPLPDRAGLAAGRRVREIVAGLTARDLLFVLLSGGASSLVETLSGESASSSLQAQTIIRPAKRTHRFMPVLSAPDMPDRASRVPGSA